jgi:hypothetical protein
MTGRSEPWVVVELVIECGDSLVASALSDALVPDNRYFPKDQEFSSSIKGPSLSFVVGSPRARQALSTVGSIVSDAKLFSDVWVEAKTRGLGSSAPQ